MTLRRSRLLTATTGLVLAASCAPQGATSQGREIGSLYDIFLWVAAAVFAVTAGLIGWSIIRYRSKPGDNDLPEQFHQNLKLEITWFAIPQIIVVVLFVLSALTLGKVNEKVPEPAAVIDVTAFQWGWRFTYEGADKEVVGTPQEPAEVVVPAGDVAFVLTSADVVHSFYVPKFLIKRDAIPGRDTRIDVSVEPGVYDGVCAEFCGLLHDRMPFTIEAVPEAEFEQWLQEPAEGTADGDG